jgi:hypothetical protein
MDRTGSGVRVRCGSARSSAASASKQSAAYSCLSERANTRDERCSFGADRRPRRNGPTGPQMFQATRGVMQRTGTLIAGRSPPRCAWRESPPTAHEWGQSWKPIKGQTACRFTLRFGRDRSSGGRKGVELWLFCTFCLPNASRVDRLYSNYSSAQTALASSVVAPDFACRNRWHFDKPGGHSHVHACRSVFGREERPKPHLDLRGHPLRRSVHKLFRS